MVCYANGTIEIESVTGTAGREGFTPWKLNENEKNSFFVITEKPSELDRYFF
jgi:hypothetical protein